MVAVVVVVADNSIYWHAKALEGLFYARKKFRGIPNHIACNKDGGRVACSAILLDDSANLWYYNIL